jgi:YHS domain-containing protein
MIHLVLAAVLSIPAPEDCLAKGSDPAAIGVTHGGKTYHLANDACRTEFLSDPERYSQLYDALLELEAEGTPLTPSPPSLVPS